MAINFPDFGGGGFDFKKVGTKNEYAGYRFNPCDDLWNASKNFYSTSFSGVSSGMRKICTSSDISGISQSTLKEKLHKGLYLIDVVIDIAPENVSQTNQTADTVEYGPSFELKIPHSHLYVSENNPANMTPMLADYRYTEFVKSTYLGDNENFRHPGFRMKSEELAFIDPDYIGANPTLTINYKLINGGNTGQSYDCYCRVRSIAFSLLYDMSDDAINDLPYQFWKED